QRRSRPGEVEGLGAHARHLGLTLQAQAALVERLVDAAAQLAERLPDLPARRLVGDLADPAQARADEPVTTAEVAVAHLLESGQVGGRGDLVEGARAQRVDVVEVLVAGGGHRPLRRRRVGAHAGASAPRATSASWLEAAASWTAISESILRLTSTPAALSPCMKWLYAMPF